MMRPQTRKSIILSLPLLIGALIAVGALNGCSGPERVSSSPPTVSYNVTGNNLTAANARASSYCRSYESAPRLLSMQNGVATYSCGTSTAGVPPTYAPNAATPRPTDTAPAYPQTSPIVPTPAE